MATKRTTTEKRLTIEQANDMAGSHAKVSVDPIDATLWRVEGDGWTQTHEPMGRAAFARLLADKCLAHDANEPPTEGPLPICPACKSALVVVGRIGMNCSNCGHVEPHEDPAARTKRQQPAIKTYAAKMPDGRTVRCTVPEDPTPDEVLFDAIKDNFSPQAVAAIAAYLQAANTKNREVNRQLAWFASELVKMLGATGYGQLLEEVGL